MLAKIQNDGSIKIKIITKFKITARVRHIAKISK
jgi:hypothetical protein